MLGYSSIPAMSAMLMVLKLYYVREDNYLEAMLALRQAQLGQRKLRKHVRKHRKAFSDAQAEIQNYHTAIQTCRNQVENAFRERNEAQAHMMQMTRERDEAMRLKLLFH
jgi:septal ring factor EnvC (AmiA/AmiB activator)